MIAEVIQVLINNATIQGKVGQNKAGSTYKVFPVVCPQGEDLNWIVCALTSADPAACKDGSLTDEYFDAICYAKKYDHVNDMGRTMISVLQGYEDNFFSDIQFQTHRDLWDNDRQAFVRVVSFKGSKH